MMICVGWMPMAMLLTNDWVVNGTSKESMNTTMV